MTSWMYVFVGGGLGSALRYIMAQNYNNVGQENMLFPLGTFLANAISCFILGILVAKQWNSTLSPSYMLLLATGFCGGFSTFSTFIFEVFQFSQKDQLLSGLGYVSLSFVVGILMLVVGIKLQQTLL